MTKFGFKSPYLFRSDSGSAIYLGCDPEDSGATCLTNAGIDSSMLSKSHVTIRYFYVANLHSPSLSNTLMSITSSADKVLSYDDSSKRLSAYAIVEERVKRSTKNIGLDIALPMILAFLRDWQR